MTAHRRGALALGLLTLAGGAGATKACKFSPISRHNAQYTSTLDPNADIHYGQRSLNYLNQFINKTLRERADSNKLDAWPPNACRSGYKWEYDQILENACEEEKLISPIFRLVMPIGQLQLAPTITTDNGKTTEKHEWPELNEVWDLERIGNSLVGYYKTTIPGKSIITTHKWPIADCAINKSSIAFLNGISTTQHGANDALWKIKEEFGDNYKTTPLKYDLLHNQTYCGGHSGLSCLADLAEVFEQRQADLGASLRNRWEIFWDTLSGRQEDISTSTGALIPRLGTAFASFISDLDSTLRNKALQLTTIVFRQPIRRQDLSDHISILNENARNNISTTIVAHSQGNLFANEIRSKYTDTTSIAPIYFVHVAPPTNTLAGKYILSDRDLIINGLGLLIPNSTPNPNVALPLSAIDKTGHGFLETYFDKSRPAFSVLRKFITDTLDLH